MMYIKKKFKLIFPFVKVRVKIIQEIINHIKAQTYLEIGVKDGGTFLEIKAPNKFAVDPFFKISIEKKLFYYLRNPFNMFNKYYEIISNAFFNNLPKKINKKGLDVVFIDGLHTHKQSLKDVLNVLKYLNKNGVIILHDCNPPNEINTYPAKNSEEVENLNLPGWDGNWCGDVWKTIPYLRASRKDLDIFVLNCDFGLGIITQNKPFTEFNYLLKDIKSFTYKDLESNRKELLNLKELGYIKQWLKKRID